MNLSGVRDELRDYLFVKDVQFASGTGLKSRFSLKVWLRRRSSRIDNELPWGTLKGEAKCCVPSPREPVNGGQRDADSGRWSDSLVIRTLGC